MSQLISLHTIKNSNFKTISLLCTNDPNISWKAKGLHTYFISRPPGWQVWKKDLINKSTDGRDAVTSGVKELYQHNYLYHYLTINTKTNQFSGGGYLILEEKITDITFIQNELAKLDDKNTKHTLNSRFHNKKDVQAVNGITSLSDSQPYSNIGIIVNRNITLSKDNEAISDLSESCRNNPKNDLIEYWNNLDFVTKHKNTNTKTYKKTSMLLKQLQKGLIDKKNSINPEFIHKNSISRDILDKKFSIDEIKEGLLRLSYFFDTQYWPIDKSKLPRSLCDLIYNPRQGSSWFLKVMMLEPKKIKEVYKTKKKYPEQQKKFRIWLSENYNISIEDEVVTRIVNDILDEHKYIFKKFAKYQPNFDSWCGTLQTNERFLIRFQEFLREAIFDGKLSVGKLSVESKTYQNFLNWLRQEYKINCDPSEEELKKMKAEYEKRSKRIDAMRNQATNPALCI